MALRLVPTTPPSKSISVRSSEENRAIKKALIEQANVATSEEHRWLLIEDQVPYGKEYNRAKQRAYQMNASSGTWSDGRWQASVRKQEDGTFQVKAAYLGPKTEQRQDEAAG